MAVLGLKTIGVGITASDLVEFLWDIELQLASIRIKTTGPDALIEASNSVLTPGTK